MTACTDKAATDEAAKFDGAAKILTEVKTTQFYTDEKVAEEDIEKILSAGVNAPSAMNTQPWHFTAVTDEEVQKKLADAMASMKPPAMKDGKSAMPPAMPEAMDGKQPPKDMPKDAPKDMPEDMPKPPEGGAGFSRMPNKAGIGDAPLTIVISCKKGSKLDAGLAVQNMSAEAQLLGYGTKIMTAPAMALNNDEYKHQINLADIYGLRTRLSAVAKHDSNCDGDETYFVRSLYFDNYMDKALREKTDGVNKREKFRIRYYGTEFRIVLIEEEIKL